MERDDELRKMEEISKIASIVKFSCFNVAKHFPKEKILSPPKVVLFADLSGSTKKSFQDPRGSFIDNIIHHFTHSAGAKTAAFILDEGIIKSHCEFHIIKTVGDEIIISFSLPESALQEDKKLGKMLFYVCLAVLKTRDVLKDLGVETKVGIHLCYNYINPLSILKQSTIKEEYKAMHNIEILDYDQFFNEKDIIGPDMNLAARIAHTAHNGQVMVSDLAFRNIISLTDYDNYLLFSEELKFQHWKGVVNLGDLDRGNDSDRIYSVLNPIRSARLVDLKRTELTPALFKWPFQTVTLISRASTGGISLYDVLSHPELKYNIQAAGIIEQEKKIFVPSDTQKRSTPKLDNDENKDNWIRNVNPNSEFLGFARMCAYDFSTYNDVINTCILSRLPQTATYSYPINTVWDEQPGEKSKFIKPQISSWLHAPPLGKNITELPVEQKLDNILILLRTVSYEQSEAILRNFIELSSITIEAGLLYGEWDMYALLRGSVSRHEINNLIKKHKEGIRSVTNGGESGLLLYYKRIGL